MTNTCKAVWTAVLAWMIVAAGPLQAAPSLASYGALPTVSEMELSPDGTKIAIVLGGIANRQLQVIQSADKKVLYAGPLGPVKVLALQWAGEHHVLIITHSAAQPYELEGPKRDYWQIADLYLDQPRLKALMQDAKDSLNTIRSIPTVVIKNGEPVVLMKGEYFPQSQGVVALYKVNLRNDVSQLVEQGQDNTTDFLVGLDGQPVARADYNQRTGRWSVSVRLGYGWKEAYFETALIDHPSLVGLSEDGQSAIVQVYDGKNAVLHEASFKDGAWSAPLDALVGLTTVIDPLTHVVIGGFTQDMDHTLYTFLSPADQKAWDAVTRAFKQSEVKLVSWSDDRRTIIVQAEGRQFGAAYFLVNLHRGTADWLADEYEDIGADDLAPTQVINYAAADGLNIPAYLTLPQHRAGKTPPPLVVLAHGGPQARDEPGFDWWSQALASRGYAVLQPQFRGSSDIAKGHVEAGYGQWGRKMQTDLSDGVRALSKKGLIDPGRVCIMGASYGGYAALAGAVFDSSVYRCAISLAGPSDLRRMLASKREAMRGANNNVLRYWDRFMGVKSSNDPRLDEVSPALHVTKATIPILLIHGKDDTVVTFEQSTEMANALKQAGKPVEFVTLKGEDHWLSRGETRLQMLTAAVAFLEKNNPPDPLSLNLPATSAGGLAEPAKTNGVAASR